MPSTEPTYHSVESPHKPRRPYFWKIVFALAVIALGVAFALLRQTSLTGVVQTDVEPAVGVYAGESPSKPLTAAQSYQTDMTKQAWPELVGVDGEVAKQTIQGENPSITLVQILPKDSMVTMDYSLNRVRIFVDDDNKVAREPRVG